MPTISLRLAREELTHGQILITHAERETKPGVADPRHTQGGLEKIRGLPIWDKHDAICCGTGWRHQEMCDIFLPRLKASEVDVSVTYSPLVGTGDALNADGTITLTSGQVIPYSQYHGIIEAAHAGWDIRTVLPRTPRLLFLGGSELFLALGGSNGIKKPGGMYFLPLESKEVMLIEG